MHEHKGNIYQDKASTHGYKRQYHKVNVESK